MSAYDAAMAAAWEAEREFARNRKPDGGGHTFPHRDVFERMFRNGAEVIDAAARASERENIRREFLDVVTANVNEGNDHVLGALLEAIRELSADDLGLDGASNDR